MYKSTNRRPFRGGGRNNGNPGRPGSNGRFHSRRSSSPNPNKGGLGRDVSVFIKKATPSSAEVPYTPRNTFSGFDIAEPLKKNILGRGYLRPTPIQDQAIEPILSGRDLIGLANTGTGKTAAFLIPIIDKLFKDKHKSALIVVPTRELAAQIDEEFRSFSRGLGLYSAMIIGGVKSNRQIREIQRNPHVIIGTPGRLKDLIRQRILHLEDFSTFVLDEVDLMVDIGFINDVKYFVTLLPAVRQSLFFSATISPKIKEILQGFVVNPVMVSVVQQPTSDNVDQDIVRVINKDKKLDQLHELLIQKGFDKVLIFGRTKHGIEKLYKQLDSRGFKAGAIHGNKKQSNRQRTLQSFKQNNIQILLATDVASRGLDIDNVTHVINYDLPETYDDYVHRIGRTGRADKKGVALTFVESGF